MKFTDLEELFLQKNPNGRIWKDDASSNHFNIVFSSPGKVYHYKATSNYALAERFDLIPELPDTVTESKRIAQELRDGADFVIGADGCWDELQWTHKLFTETEQFEDEYQRPMAKYRMPTEEEIAKHTQWIGEEPEGCRI